MKARRRNSQIKAHANLLTWVTIVYIIENINGGLK
jgi:hypothetical protein